MVNTRSVVVGLAAALAVLVLGLLSTGAQAGLVAHYTFDAPADLGGDVAGGHEGSVVGAGGYSTNARVGSGSLRLTGGDDGISVLNFDGVSTFSTLTNFTIAGFVHSRSTSGIQRIFGNRGTNNGYGFGLNGPDLRYTTFGIQDYNQNAVPDIPANQWSHIAVSVSGGNATFYANGINQGTINGGNPNSAGTNYHIGSGGFAAADRFAGLIDDLQVYDTALTGPEVAALANTPLPAPAPGPTLVTPLSASVSVPQFYAVRNLIDDSGLNAVPNISNYPTITHGGPDSSNAWVTNAFFPDYFSGGGSPPVMTLDLGNEFALTDLVAWNYSVPGNAARAITAEFSTTGVGGLFGSPVTIEVPQAVGAAHTISLGGTFLANAVRLTFDSNWVGFGAGGDRVGLAELKFIGASPNAIIPEPSAFLIWSLGLLGLSGWRRRRTK